MAWVAKRCVPVSSSWVLQFIQGCGGEFAVQFRRGARRPRGAGVPGVVCHYPTAPAHYFDLALTWGSPGHFVHRFLYKRLPYRLIASPCPPPAGGCGVSTPCCANPVPTTLTATFSGGLSGSYTLTYDGSVPGWRNGNCALCGDGPSTVTMVCQAGHWFLTINPNVGTTSACSSGSTRAQAGGSCNPFSQTFNPGGAACCSFAFTVTVTQ